VQESSIRAATVFDGEVRDQIVALKYHNARRHCGPLGLLLTESIERVATVGFDVVTWAPTSSGHRRRRGYDQAELIAREVARRLNVPAHGVLRRRGSVAQTGRSRRERLVGPVFRAHRSVRGKRMLVIDDVTTTGATLRAARRALRAEGAVFVDCWAVAATPAR
jgi:predicted amidophosphoribosyltransferase